MAQAVIASAVRTPIGAFPSARAGVPPRVMGLRPVEATRKAREMARREARLGVAALCVGGGQGIAMVVERPEGAPGG
jgi:Thiolase, C-terminal domain